MRKISIWIISLSLLLAGCSVTVDTNEVVTQQANNDSSKWVNGKVGEDTVEVTGGMQEVMNDDTQVTEDMQVSNETVVIETDASSTAVIDPYSIEIPTIKPVEIPDIKVTSFNIDFGDNKTSTETQTVATTTVSNDTNENDNVKVKKVGSDLLGYIDIPIAWMQFLDDTGIEYTPMLQYTDGKKLSDGTFLNVITLSYYDNSNVTIDTAVEATKYKYNSYGGSEASVYSGTIGGYSCTCVETIYDSLDQHQITYIFIGKDNLVHTVSLEVLSDDLQYKSILDTFKL